MTGFPDSTPAVSIWAADAERSNLSGADAGTVGTGICRIVPPLSDFSSQECGKEPRISYRGWAEDLVWYFPDPSG